MDVQNTSPKFGRVHGNMCKQDARKPLRNLHALKQAKTDDLRHVISVSSDKPLPAR
jgi:hypothetical protein